jgi:hypothetical protein
MYFGGVAARGFAAESVLLRGLCSVAAALICSLLGRVSASAWTEQELNILFAQAEPASKVGVFLAVQPLQRSNPLLDNGVARLQRVVALQARRVGAEVEDARFRAEPVGAGADEELG